MNYTHLMCEHNFEVLAYLKFVGIEWEEIEVLIPVFQQAAARGTAIDINSELTDAFEARLAEKLEEFEETEE
jgi:histidinol phosphatase-like PHP family hydrolase